ncbi:hypothetical protein ABGB17_20355 [Sphaerisporangium sp. B11E5]|uniref:hypothetical protein n=1 Tax=Sphaerisporangium sp. B11E5 TaxID=3153563 RepID=UPI00325C7D3E
MISTNAEGRTPGQESALNSAPYSTNNADPQGTAQTGPRHGGQQTSLPGVVEALLFIDAHRVTATLIVVGCERCGGDHEHRCPLPVPSLTREKRARCGLRYQIMPRRLRATRRGRRAA